jgi:hypothetical protein
LTDSRRYIPFAGVAKRKESMVIYHVISDLLTRAKTGDQELRNSGSLALGTWGGTM